MDARINYCLLKAPFSRILEVQETGTEVGRKVNMKLQFWLLRAQLIRKDTKGQDLIEYALMAGFVAVAAGAMFPSTIMPGVSNIFSKINSTLGLA